MRAGLGRLANRAVPSPPEIAHVVERKCHFETNQHFLAIEKYTAGVVDENIKRPNRALNASVTSRIDVCDERSTNMRWTSSLPVSNNQVTRSTAAFFTAAGENDFSTHAG